jgi:hypothetical protein
MEEINIKQDLDLAGWPASLSAAQNNQGRFQWIIPLRVGNRPFALLSASMERPRLWSCLSGVNFLLIGVTLPRRVARRWAAFIQIVQKIDTIGGVYDVVQVEVSARSHRIALWRGTAFEEIIQQIDGIADVYLSVVIHVSAEGATGIDDE